MLGSYFTCYRKSEKQTDQANFYTYLAVKLHYLAAYITKNLVHCVTNVRRLSSLFE